MAKVTAAYLTELQALRSLYVRQLPEKAQAVARAASAVAEARHRPHLGSLYRLAHRLTGSAAIFGFPGVSEAASALEVFLISAMQDGGPWAAKRRLRLQALAATLGKACVEGATLEGTRRSSPHGRRDYHRASLDRRAHSRLTNTKTPGRGSASRA